MKENNWKTACGLSLGLILFSSILAYGQNSYSNIDHYSYQSLGVSTNGDYSSAIELFKDNLSEINLLFNISCQSAITSDYNSSWVGCNWSLCPGAITRTISNMPDDWNNAPVEQFVEYAPSNSHSGHEVWIGYNMNSYASPGLQRIIGSTKKMFDFRRKIFKNTDQGSFEGYGILYMKNGLKSLVPNASFGGSQMPDYVLQDVLFVPTTNSTVFRMKNNNSGKE